MRKKKKMEDRKRGQKEWKKIGKEERIVVREEGKREQT